MRQLFCICSLFPADGRARERPGAGRPGESRKTAGGTAVRIALLGVGLALLVTMGGCGPSENPHAAAPAAGQGPTAEALGTERFGSARMAALLDTLAATARQDPEAYFHLNALAADSLQERIRRGAAAPSQRFAYAYRLLYGGQTREAIDELGALLTDLRASPLNITPGMRPAFELLAVAYMRLGEEENCLQGHSPRSCILPIVGDGVHTRQAGARRAMGLYARLARTDPGDLQSRWLLNLAAMTVGAYPDEVAEALRIPNLGAPAGTGVGRLPDRAAALGVAHRGLSGGVSVDDFDGDGHLDILATSYGIADPMRLYLADGAGGFVDRTVAAGLAGITGGLNTVHADYDNDGDPDVLVLRGAWLGEHGRHPNSLLRNEGDGTFVDITFEAGLGALRPTQVAAWADANGDGWVDLFVGNESQAEYDFLTGAADAEATPSHPSALYLNRGDGTFEERAAEAGLRLDAYVKGAAWGDPNGDGRPDLYASVLGGANRLFVNRGSGPDGRPRFTDRAAAAGVEGPFYSFPTWFWDYDNDGDDDLFVADYDVRHLTTLPASVAAEHLGRAHEVERPRVYRNEGDGTFADVTAALGFDTVLFAMGANRGDLDNDGYQDVYIGTGAPDLRSLVPNRMFRNRGGRRFEEVTYDAGVGHLQKGHGVAFADFDRDGDQDVYTVVGGAVDGDVFPNALFENPGHGNGWVTLVLEGRKANRSAIGARLALSLTDPDGRVRRVHRTVSTGGSFGASSLQQEIGLGAAAQIDTLRVTWPGPAHTRQVFTGVEAGRTYRLVEGAALEPLDRPPVPFADGRSPHPSGHHGGG
jgi:hypothetical protein